MSIGKLSEEKGDQTLTWKQKEEDGQQTTKEGDIRRRRGKIEGACWAKITEGNGQRGEKQAVLERVTCSGISSSCLTYK